MFRSSIKQVLSETFSKKTKNILDVLKEMTIGTNTNTCIRGSSREYRPCNIYKIIIMARQKEQEGNMFIDPTNFTFEKYVTKLKGVFKVLKKYGVLLYE